MVATFSAFSAKSYDRASIIPSPSPAATWSGLVVSPTFQLADAPKRTPRTPTAKGEGIAPIKRDYLTVAPPFQDPRSPKPYRSATAVKEVTLTVPAPRAPKPSRVTHTSAKDTLTVPPPFEDPRSPKPYQSLAGVGFEELVLHVPRGNHAVGDLSTALSTYPRSPYPSAPIHEGERVTTRGRPGTLKPASRLRARSLEQKSKRRQNIGSHVVIPSKQNFLSPVTESPWVTGKPAPLNLEAEEALLNQAFWQSVSLEEEDTSSMQGVKSPPSMMFGNQDGSLWTLWSPRPGKKEQHRGLMQSILSPAQKKLLSKGMVASPSPHDPFAAFPSFSVALMSADGVISYPPRAHVEL